MPARQKRQMSQNKMTSIPHEVLTMTTTTVSKKSKITPYEAVGVVAAQSIGEPGTQMSLPYDEKVIIREGREIKIVEIGAFIDNMMKRFGSVSQEDHEICDLPIEVYVPSLHTDEKIRWQKVTALSKHKSPKQLIKITLASGKKITATPFHSFVIRKNNAIVAVSAAELKKGERLPVAPNMSIKTVAESEVVWDEITSIEYVASRSAFVYDFTVPGTETFTTAEGIVTHNTMRTFHYAGVAEQVPTGLPRLIEIVDAKKEPKKPIIDIRLKGEFSESAEKAEKVARELECIMVEDVAHVEDDMINKRIIIVYNESDGKALGVSFAALRNAIEKTLPIAVIKDNKIMIKPIKKGKKMEGAAPAASASEVPAAPQEENITTLRFIRRLSNKIRKLIIKGVAGITKAVVLKDEDGYFIRASGFNIMGVITHPAVEPSKIYTNNIKEIENVFGVEAARNALVREIKQVLEMQKLFVDIRHIMLVADAICASGQVKSIGRHGLSGGKAGVFGRAAFEETLKHLINASANGEEDNLVGVTENIIVGQTVPIGTGKIKLTMKMPKSK